VVTCLGSEVQNDGPGDAAATPTSLASLKSRISSAFLVLAYQGCPGKEAVEYRLIGLGAGIWLGYGPCM